MILSRNRSLSVNKQRRSGYYQALEDYHLEHSTDLELLLDIDTNKL